MTVRSFENQEPVIHESAWIDPSALVAGRVTLGEDVSVWPKAVIRGDVNTISVGSKTNIQDGAVLHCTHDGPYTRGGKTLTIGECVTVGHQACFMAVPSVMTCLWVLVPSCLMAQLLKI